ncbi:MAG: hypothetical protein IPI18_09915 [Saprospiraceae bacterium]|nr:hypothetical protein [Saprospiraceae bacterium]
MPTKLLEERSEQPIIGKMGSAPYTPPGHLNEFTKEFIVKYKLNPLRSARTFAYLNMAMMDGVLVVDAKYYYHYPRPIPSDTGL